MKNCIRNLTRLFLILLAIMMLFLEGCRTSPIEQTSITLPTVEDQSTFASTETEIESNTLQPAPSVVYTPSKTVSVISTPIPTLTLVSIPSLTPLPTLSSLASENYIRTLLEDNGKCTLPCIWGIVPGKTSYQDAQKFFNHLGWKGSEFDGVYYTGRDIENMSFSIDVGIYAPGGEVVEKINFAFNGNDFIKEINYFSIKNILTVLGKPSDVLAYVGVNPLQLTFKEAPYEILFFYEKQNILIQYNGTAIRVGEKYRLCLSQPNATSSAVSPGSGNVGLFVGETGKPSNPETILPPFWVLQTYYLPMEKAFGISMDDFYKIIIQNDRNLCLNSLQKVWLQKNN
jgi:hypothetical protein